MIILFYISILAFARHFGIKAVSFFALAAIFAGL
jgi:hypothetical protein